MEYDAVRREVVVPGQVGRKSDRLDYQRRLESGPLLPLGHQRSDSPGSDIDPLLMRGGQEVAAVEVQLLSDLGPQQLARYRAAFPSVEVYRVLHLDKLPVNLREPRRGSC